MSRGRMGVLGLRASRHWGLGVLRLTALGALGFLGLRVQGLVCDFPALVFMLSSTLGLLTDFPGT